LLWRYPASASWLRDQAAVHRALLQADDLGGRGWQPISTTLGKTCDGTPATAIAWQAFVESGRQNATTASLVYLYATRAKARHAFAALQSNLATCLSAGLPTAERKSARFSRYHLKLQVPASGLAGILRSGGSTAVVHYSYALVGRAVVSLMQNANGSSVTLSAARETALVRLMASRIAQP
jgi:hypothetical protein